ncbi:MAG TPA: hypothetical protein VJ741_18335, partial [Solirubrobacteraceae bacterium]|nr:hypothetical protein [Solirubrobacteraceae bacterium]
MGFVAVVITVVVVVLVLVLLVEVDVGVLVLVLGVEVECCEVELVVGRAGAAGPEADEVDVLEPPDARAYATAAPTRSTAMTARKAHGPRFGGRRGGSGRVGALGSGVIVAAWGTVAICGTSAAAATAVSTSAAG